MPAEFFLAILALAIAVPIAGLLIFWLRRKKLPARARAKIQKNWAKISADPDPGRALLAADKLLDFALREMGFRGTFVEKISAARGRFSDADGIFRAHRLRNRLAHEVDFRPGPAAARAAIRAFARGLRDLGAGI